MAEDTQTTKKEPAVPHWMQEVNRGRIIVEWEFPEYEKHERGKLWYVIAFTVGGLLLWYAVADANFLFALILLLFALIIFTHHRTEPLPVRFAVYDAGLEIGSRFYLFREIKSFSVIYEPPITEQLYIMPKDAVLRREIPIPLAGQNPLQIRSLLLDFIEEDLEREEESGSDQISRLLKL